MQNRETLMLPERQVWQIRRVSDYAFIGVMETAFAAVEIAEEYENAWGEACEVSPTYVAGTESVADRERNAKV